MFLFRLYATSMIKIMMILKLNEQSLRELFQKYIEWLQNRHVRIEVIIWELNGEKIFQIQLVSGDRRPNF